MFISSTEKDYINRTLNYLKDEVDRLREKYYSLRFDQPYTEQVDTKCESHNYASYAILYRDKDPLIIKAFSFEWDDDEIIFYDADDNEIAIFRDIKKVIGVSMIDESGEGGIERPIQDINPNPIPEGIPWIFQRPWTPPYEITCNTTQECTKGD